MEQNYFELQALDGFVYPKDVRVPYKYRPFNNREERERRIELYRAQVERGEPIFSPESDMNLIDAAYRNLYEKILQLQFDPIQMAGSIIFKNENMAGKFKVSGTPEDYSVHYSFGTTQKLFDVIDGQVYNFDEQKLGLIKMFLGLIPEEKYAETERMSL